MCVKMHIVTKNVKTLTIYVRRLACCGTVEEHSYACPTELCNKYDVMNKVKNNSIKWHAHCFIPVQRMRLLTKRRNTQTPQKISRS